MRERIKAAGMRARGLLLVAVKALAAVFSVRDLLCFGGLGCIWYGLSQVYPPAAWCVVGGAFFWLSTRRSSGAA